MHKIKVNEYLRSVKKKMTEKQRNEEYLAKIYELLKKPEKMELNEYQPMFNNSEMRLLGEIIKEHTNGGKIISTEISRRLGITRSAVSQMVNKLEERGIIKRSPSPTDKKIAYVELSESAEKKYWEEHEKCCVFMGKVIERFGLERLDQLLALNDEFLSVVGELKK